MIDGNPTGTEWVEMAWAARNALQPGMNVERRAEFEAVKQLWRLWPIKAKKTAAEIERDRQNYTDLQNCAVNYAAGFPPNIINFGLGAR